MGDLSPKCEAMHGLCPEVLISQRMAGNPKLLGLIRANVYENPHIVHT